MEVTISRCLGIWVLGAAFSAPSVPAQTATGMPAGVRRGPAVVSADLLRHPIPAKARTLLLKAIDKMESGDHAAAIRQLLDTLTKYPSSAAFVHNLLGVEYVKTDRFQEAVSSFEQAVSLLPHDAMTHYNFGLALVCAGDYDRATQEVQRALELDPRSAKMQARLESLLAHKRPGN